jgi:cobalt-zinc-cadmium efflux system protein
MQPTVRAATISGAACTVLAVPLWVFVAIEPSVVLIVGASLTTSRPVTGFLVVAGVRLSRRHTRAFPDGLYKLGNLLALVIGLLVAVGACELGCYAIAHVVSGEEALQGPLLVIVVMTGVVAATAGLAVYESRVRRKHGSPSLPANARHAWTDAFASGGVALGVGLQWAGTSYMDSVAALVVVALLARGGVGVLRDGLRVMLVAD